VGLLWRARLGDVPTVLDAADYWFDYSDDSSAGSYDLACECFAVVVDDQADGANAAGAGDREAPRNPGAITPQNLGPSVPPTSPTRGADINTQLAQARELEAKLAEEYRAVRLLHASFAGEASARGEHARELGKQDRECINADFDVNNTNMPPLESQKLIAAATLLRAMPTPSTPEAQNLHREAQALIEQAAVQQAESSASRIRQQGSARDDGGAKGPEASVHVGSATGQPACRMDLPGPTTSVGTRTDYSVGLWDYPACATRHLKAWSTRNTQE
jgi:hypothetical protein